MPFTCYIIFNNNNMAMSVNEMDFLQFFYHTGSSIVIALLYKLDSQLLQAPGEVLLPGMFFHRFLQQAFFSSCASSAAALGWDNVTALIEPRVTSLLLTFLWISERKRSNNDSMIVIMKPSAYTISSLTEEEKPRGQGTHAKYM